MFDWILSQNCRNTLPLHTVDQVAKNVDTAIPDQFLAARANTSAYQMEEYKNSSLVVILHCLNSFQHNKYVTFLLLYVFLKDCFLIFK